MDFFSIFLPNIAYADFNSFLGNVNSVIVNPLIRLLFALGIAYFLYGVFVFLTNADNETERTAGKSHMLYGVVGLTIMMGVWGILNLVLNTLNIDKTEIDPEAGTVNLNDYSPTTPFNPGGSGAGAGATGTGTTGNGTGSGIPSGGFDLTDVNVVNDNVDPGETSNPSSGTGNTSQPSGFDPVIETSANTNSTNTVDPSLPTNTTPTNSTNFSQSETSNN